MFLAFRQPAQKFQQHDPPVAADAPDHAGFEFADHAVEPPHGCLSGVGEMKRVGTTVARRRPALGQAAPLEAVDQRHEVRPFDAERGRDLRLRAAGIMRDHGEHGKLRRADAEFGEGAEDVLENRDLRAPQHVADQASERADVDVGRARGRVLSPPYSSAAHEKNPEARRVDNSTIVMQHYK